MKTKQEKELRLYKSLLVILCIIVIMNSWLLMVYGFEPKSIEHLALSGTKDAIVAYYEEHGYVPATLDFIEDEKLKREIDIVDMEWYPEKLELQYPNGYHEYYHSNLYRFSFGLLGDNDESYFTPGGGATFKHLIPEGTPIQETTPTS